MYFTKHPKTMTCTHHYNLRSNKIQDPWHKPLSVAFQHYSASKPAEIQLHDLQQIYSIISNHIHDIIHDGDDAYINAMILKHQAQLVNHVGPQLRSRSQHQDLDDLLGKMVNIHMRLVGL
jgi:hypothetical protein